MMSCVCCLKKRGEVYLLRNARGVENRRNEHLKNSNENIPERAAEEGAVGGQAEYTFDKEEDKVTFAGLEAWQADLPSSQYELRNRTTASVHVPPAQQLVDSTIENEML